MSSRNAPADPPLAGRDPAGAWVLPVQLALGLAYPFLAHAAATHGGGWPALALGDLAVLVLAAPLLHRRLWALALLAALLAALAWIAATPWPSLLLLGVAYPFLAHLAGTRGGMWPALALADLVLLMLVLPLLHRRWWALGLLAASLALLAGLAGTIWLDLLLLAPPVLFTGWLAWWFARSLLGGREPLIARIVAALYARAGWPTSPELLAYARRLTAGWAAVLAFLTLANAALALVEVPGGVLDLLGRRPWFAVSPSAWSWFANLLNYGVLGGFMLGEFAYRKRRFPRRPYRNALDFGRQMAALGAGFWRDLLR